MESTLVLIRTLFKAFAFCEAMYVLKVISILTLVCLVWGLEECITPMRTEGICKLINDCHDLKVLEIGQIEARNLLKEWQCGYNGEMLHVCCPKSSSTSTTITTTTSTPSTTTTVTVTTTRTNSTTTTATSNTTSTISDLTTTTTITTTTTTEPLKDNYNNSSSAINIKDKCVTLENTNGTCVGLTKCPGISDRLKQATPEALEYVLRSRCIGTEQYSVCCDVNKEASYQMNSSTSMENRYSTNTNWSAAPESDHDRNSTSKNLKAYLEAENNSECQQSSGLPEPEGNCCGLEAIPERSFRAGVTSIYQYPWLALLEYDNVKKKSSGSLISSLYVLTAAHSIVNGNHDTGAKSVRLGEYNTKNNGKDCVYIDGDGDLEECTDGAISIAIASKYVHPDYQNKESPKLSNDIALVKLTHKAPYSDFIRPICLPRSDITESPPLDLKFYVSGWGAINETIRSSNVKLHVDLPYVDLRICSMMFDNGNIQLLADKQICAGSEGKDTCEGDSGVPLMYLKDDRFEIVGVTSFGPRQCGTIFGVYTKVFAYIPWIKSIVIT